MSNIYEALQVAQSEQPDTDPFAPPTWVPDYPAAPASIEEIPLDQVPPLQPAAPIDPRLVAITDGHGLGAEQFRVLSIRLRDLQRQNGLKKILVTSSISGEGKSLIAANLAASLAQSAQQKILLLGGDLRCLALNRFFGCNGLVGLSEYLVGNASFSNYLYRVAPLPLWFMPGGTSSSQAVQLLESGRLKELLAAVDNAFDWVIIDSSPLLPLADANVWARMVDGTLLVVREGNTPKKLLQKAVDVLGNVQLLGIVINDRTRGYDDIAAYGDSASRPSASNKLA
jgi:capsular exopolysaccharide synthesis family protein